MATIEELEGALRLQNAYGRDMKAAKDAANTRVVMLEGELRYWKEAWGQLWMRYGAAVVAYGAPKPQPPTSIPCKSCGGTGSLSSDKRAYSTD